MMLYILSYIDEQILALPPDSMFDVKQNPVHVSSPLNPDMVVLHLDICEHTILSLQ